MATLQGLPLPTPRVCPVTGGGIHFAWQVQDREVEIEILPDGSAEYLVVEKESNSGVERTLEGSLPLDRREIGQALGEWLITGARLSELCPNVLTIRVSPTMTYCGDVFSRTGFAAKVTARFVRVRSHSWTGDQARYRYTLLPFCSTPAWHFKGGRTTASQQLRQVIRVSLGFAIVRDPKPDDPSHALICPSPTGSKAEKLPRRRPGSCSVNLIPTPEKLPSKLEV